MGGKLPARGRDDRLMGFRAAWRWIWALMLAVVASGFVPAGAGEDGVEVGKKDLAITVLPGGRLMCEGRELDSLVGLHNLLTAVSAKEANRGLTIRAERIEPFLALLIKDLREMPRGATTKVVRKDDTLVIEITMDGVVQMDGAVLEKSTLHKRLREVAGEAPDRQIRIDAYRETPFRHVVYVLDLCEFEGLKNVRLRASE